MISLKVIVLLCSIYHLSKGAGKMGEETDRSIFSTNYRGYFAYEIDGRAFMYAEDNTSNWIIRELLPDGKVGSPTDAGPPLYSNPLTLVFPYVANGKHYFFGHRKYTGIWSIHELLPGGKMGDENPGGASIFYDVGFPFYMNRRIFYWNQCVKTRFWVTNELGTILWVNDLNNVSRPTRMVDNDRGSSFGHLDYVFHVGFAYSINVNHYIYLHTYDSNIWRIYELLPGGKVGKMIKGGSWNNPHSIIYPYSINNRQFFYGQMRDTTDWFIQELLPGGEMGSETDHGTWPGSYDVGFLYSINGTYFYFAQNLNEKIWFIRKLD